METQPNENLLPIRVVGEVLTVSSLDFAAGLGIQHKNLLETIRGHQKAIEEGFGGVAFETEPLKTKGGTQRKHIAYLTEEQALFVGTLSRNSKRVIEFKSTLVKSFVQARKQLAAEQPAAPAQLSTDQVLLQLASQQTQLLLNQQEQLDRLRDEVEQIKATGQRPPRQSGQARPGQQLRLPGTGPAAYQQTELRQLINRRIDDYCDRFGYEHRDTWTYLYKRLFEVYGINTHRLTKGPRESLLDVLARYGHLDRLYSLVMAELTYSEG